MELKEVVKFIPKVHQQIIKDRCKAQKDYVKLLDKLAKARYTKQMVLVVTLQQAIKQYEIAEYIKFLEVTTTDRVAVSEMKEELGPELSWELIHKTNTALICVDIIEGLAIEIHEIIKPFMSGGKIKLYDTLLKLGQEAKAIRKEVVDSGDMVYQIDFGDMSDELRLMLESQVKIKTNKNIKLRAKENEQQTT